MNKCMILRFDAHAAVHREAAVFICQHLFDIGSDHEDQRAGHKVHRLMKYGAKFFRGCLSNKFGY